MTQMAYGEHHVTQLPQPNGKARGKQTQQKSGNGKYAYRNDALFGAIMQDIFEP